MSENKFSNCGYTGKVSEESTKGIIHNTGCCFGFSQGGYVVDPNNPKPAGVVSGGYCLNMQTGEVRDSIDDFLKDAKINKTEE